MALAYAPLADRARVLSLLVQNAPDKLTEVKNLGDYSVKFSDRLRNCEDALLVEEDRVAILSCDPGRDFWNTVMGTFAPDLSTVPTGELVLYRYDSAKYSDADALVSIELRDFDGIKGFHPLGIEYHRASSSLFVCNHHYEGSRVEVFTLDLDAPKPVARHQRTIISPLVKAPNAIAALNEHELYITNDHYFLQKDSALLSHLETYAQIPLGSVAYVNLATEDHPAEVHSVARSPFTNGVALLNESALAVSSSSTTKVYLYEILPDRSLLKTGDITLPFMPDNLSVDKKGALLIAGHPHPPTLDKWRKDRFECLMNNSRQNEDCYEGTTPSGVAEWSADDGLKILHLTKGGFATSCTAVRDTEYKLGFMTGLYEKGILVWKG